MSERLEPARAALADGDFESALDALIEVTETLLNVSCPAWRLPIGWRPADALCDEIGDALLAGLADTAAELEDLDLYVATQLYAGGGHTAVIGDFVQASAASRSEVLITGAVERDIHGPDGASPKPEIVERLGVEAGAVSVCPESGRVAATRWLMVEIRARRPRRVFLFHHPQDAVAIAGCRASLCDGLFLVHHADRQPALGLYQRGTNIVDLSPYTGNFTRRVLGLPNFYAPLTIADPGPPPERAIRPPFTTVSSGSAHKFGKSYAENVARVLETTGGRHIHIGFLKEKRLEKIRAHLVERGLDPGRFEYLRWVPSLAKALIELQVDLCIGSAPLGGARTAIEACAAGVPSLSHHPPFSTAFGASHVVPDSWPKWTSSDELIALLEGIDAAWLVEQGRIGRAFYEQNHAPETLRSALSDLGQRPFPERDDLDLSELLDQAATSPRLTGDWEFLRAEFGGKL